MTHAALERVARASIGRLTASLARRTGDLGAAEDALSHALVRALERWPDDGVPSDPEAWLYTVARRSLVGQWRHAEVRARKAEALRALAALEVPEPGDRWPDERLPLLFACAHPAIDTRVRAPLMLQAVLGLRAEDIAPLLGVPAKTLGQRLWRAKKKIRAAGIPLEVPDALEARLQDVLEAVYGLYAASRAATVGREACWLAEVLVEVVPTSPEVLGLAALLHYVHARRAAGRADGYVPLFEQDPASWDAAALARADRWLTRAQRAGRTGPFQLEAAIQSALVHGLQRGRVDHGAVLILYDALVQRWPTTGLAIGRAAAAAEVHGPARGLELLDALEGAERFQAYWAVRADLTARVGQVDEAVRAYGRAIAQSEDDHVSVYLQRKLTQLNSRL